MTNKKIRNPEVIRYTVKIGIRNKKRQNVASVSVLPQLSELGKKNKLKGPKDAVKNFDRYLYKKNGFKLASDL